MLYVFLVIVSFIGLRYLVITRKINPDNYFKHRIGPIAFTHVVVRQSSSGIRISAVLDDEYKTIPSGKMSYSINNGYALYDDEYSYEVDGSDNFILYDQKSQKSFLLGKVVSKTFSEYTQSDHYKIELPKDYKGVHTFARGVFPYYVPIQFTMMSSGGMKYSTEMKTLLISPKGDTLKLYQNTGHIDHGEKTGIYP